MSKTADLHQEYQDYWVKAQTSPTQMTFKEFCESKQYVLEQRYQTYLEWYKINEFVGNPPSYEDFMVDYDQNHEIGWYSPENQQCIYKTGKDLAGRVQEGWRPLDEMDAAADPEEDDADYYYTKASK